jgi:hypothetical protein
MQSYTRKSRSCIRDYVTKGYTKKIRSHISKSWQVNVYNSKKFDIHKEPERFIKVLAGYALMSNAELGSNTFIKRDGNGKYIVTRDVRISLKDKLIALTKAIVCRGITCYRGRRPGITD